MMATEKSYQKRDGIDYVIEPVKSGGKVVGQAAIRVAKDLDDLLEFLTPEQTFKLAYRQLTQDVMNTVRSAAIPSTPTMNDILEAIADGTIDMSKAPAAIKANPELTAISYARQQVKLHQATNPADGNEINWAAWKAVIANGK
jgi:hypothetical protein